MKKSFGIGTLATVASLAAVGGAALYTKTHDWYFNKKQIVCDALADYLTDKYDRDCFIEEEEQNTSFVGKIRNLFTNPLFRAYFDDDMDKMFYVSTKFNAALISNNTYITAYDNALDTYNWTRFYEICGDILGDLNNTVQLKDLPAFIKKLKARLELLKKAVESDAIFEDEEISELWYPVILTIIDDDFKDRNDSNDNRSNYNPPVIIPVYPDEPYEKLENDIYEQILCLQERYPESRALDNLVHKLKLTQTESAKQETDACQEVDEAFISSSEELKRQLSDD